MREKEQNKCTAKKKSEVQNTNNQMDFHTKKKYTFILYANEVINLEW